MHASKCFEIQNLTVWCEITSQTNFIESVQSHEGDRSHLARGHAEGCRGEEGRDELLHLADDKRLHEKSHRC